MRADERTPEHVARHKAKSAKGWATRWAAMADPESTIVAEVSKNYVEGEPLNGLLLSAQFEKVIVTNDARGYRLRDWQLSRVFHAPNIINETIIAVFERRRAGTGRGIP